VTRIGADISILGITAALALIAASTAPALAAMPSSADARDTMRRLAQCVVSRDKGLVARIIAVPVDSVEGVRAAKRLFDTTDETCLSEGAVDYNATLFRGAVFEALYTRDFRYNGPTVFPTNIATGYAALYTAPYSIEARQAMALEQFGECVARAEPVEARKLLLALPDSAIEREQFALLAPRFGACVVKGSTVAMSKSIIRGALAEGMYRLSRVVADGQMGGAK
jgi:hypothetical protein